MSTITKEWLQQTIAEYEANRDELPFGLDTNSAIELQAFKLALASLEAEPVGFIVRNKETGQFGSWMHSKADWFKDDGYEVLNAYIAPPAPVSDDDLLHMAASAIDDLLSNKDRSGAWAWADIPAKLRLAAMLQGADGNSPVVPDELIRRIAFNLVYLSADEKLRSDDDSLFSLVRCGMDEFRRELDDYVRPPVVPDGYTLMPVEPTEAMLEAGKCIAGLTKRPETVRLVYEAMLAAAQQQEV
ncbi:hypothetical protein ACLEZA_17855 [Enterobacter ludwigii]|uniref:hypothetical protein n=1 Tax=Enterobacter ludwigii TaxID=299767 RepID=UPI003974E48B